MAAGIVAADRDAGGARTDRSRYLAALASLELTSADRDAFRSIALVAPLKQSLAAKKSAMERALAGYQSAADYSVAEVTTAATFEMGELYRQLAADLMNSERPADLDAEELEQYDLLLEEQAFPFEEKAAEVHASNARRAAEGLYDEWVRKSYAVLAELQPARFGKQVEAEAFIAELACPRRRAGRTPARFRRRNLRVRSPGPARRRRRRWQHPTLRLRLNRVLRMRLRSSRRRILRGRGRCSSSWSRRSRRSRRRR